MQARNILTPDILHKAIVFIHPQATQSQRSQGKHLLADRNIDGKKWPALQHPAHVSRFTHGVLALTACCGIGPVHRGAQHCRIGADFSSQPLQGRSLGAELEH